MLFLIDSIHNLKKYRSFIEFLSRNSAIFHHDYRSFEAKFLAKKRQNFIIFFDKKTFLLTAFERDNTENFWRCFIYGYPFLFGDDLSYRKIEIFLNLIIKKLNTNILYFPLVYKNSKIYKILSQLSKVYIWDRLPCPIVKGKLSEEIIWRRVINRFGSRANRQKKKFEKDLYVVRKVNHIEKVIKKIELNSWKRKCKQDMLSRDDQFEYYTQIIKSGLAKISVVFNKKNEPVAYRIDSLIKRILYVLKWSYDENYKRYSPGFYLITVDLFKKYESFNLDYIDLYGSPDLLKDLIETDRIERVDICYSVDDGIGIKKLKKRKVEYDKKIETNYLSKKGIKKLFSL